MGLIVQGLGTNDLITQGFGPTEASEYTASGTVRTGSAGTYGLAFAYSPGGTITLSGGENMAVIKLFTGSGGVVVSGSCGFLPGASLRGSAGVKAGYHIAPTGRIRLGGSAGVGSPGVTLGGSASVTYSFGHAGSGRVRLGGGAVPALLVSPPASGSVITFGSAACSLDTSNVNIQGGKVFMFGSSAEAVVVLFCSADRVDCRFRCLKRDFWPHPKRVFNPRTDRTQVTSAILPVMTACAVARDRRYTEARGRASVREIH